MIKSPSRALSVAILGGGAAGMSCALWLKQLGYTPIIIEPHHRLGGQLLSLNRVNRWVLGAPNKTSTALAEAYADHVSIEAITCVPNARVLAISEKPAGYELVIQTPDQLGRLLLVRALVIATGTRALSHEIFSHLPSFQSVQSSGLLSFFPIDHLDHLTTLHGKTIAIIGGGDNAYFTAIDVAQAGALAYLLIRSSPKAKMSVRQATEPLIQQGLIIERTQTQVSVFRQHQDGIEISLNHAADKINVDRIFVRAGFAPNTEFLGTFAVFSDIAQEAGYLLTDSAKRTSIPWVYAIGDVANSTHQSVVSAIADGAIAAQDLSKRA